MHFVCLKFVTLSLTNLQTFFANKTLLIKKNKLNLNFVSVTVDPQDDLKRGSDDVYASLESIAVTTNEATIKHEPNDDLSPPVIVNRRVHIDDSGKNPLRETTNIHERKFRSKSVSFSKDRPEKITFKGKTNHKQAKNFFFILASKSVLTKYTLIYREIKL